MDRRQFLGKTLAVGGSLLASGITTKQAHADDYFVDNDEMAEQIKEAVVNGVQTSLSPEDLADLRHEIAVPRTFLPFAEVTSYLSEYLESKFDYFLFANTFTNVNAGDTIGAQTLQVHRRTNPGAPVFVRDGQGQVMDFQPGTLQKTIPISSGNGYGGILTFSGIFRFNHKRSAYPATSIHAPMSYQSYIDFRYNGKESGVAIHGTPPRNLKYLGVSRASHGCMRTRPEFAQEVRNMIFSKSNFDPELPKFDLYSPLPSEAVRRGESGTNPGYKALMIIFEGYKERRSNV